MKILLQIALVLGIYWVSLGIESVLPFPFPASVISLILLLILLLIRAVKVKHVAETADFMMGNLGLFFLPVSSGVMKYADIIFDNAVPLLTVCVISTALTFDATAWTVQLTCRLLEKRKETKK